MFIYYHPLAYKSCLFEKHIISLKLSETSVSHTTPCSDIGLALGNALSHVLIRFQIPYIVWEQSWV